MNHEECLSSNCVLTPACTVMCGYPTTADALVNPRAVRNARGGLVGDAAQEWRELVAENPDSPAARRLLENIQRGSPTTNPAP